MIKEKKILFYSWVISIILLIVFVPKSKIREAQVIFFFKQMLSWLFGLTVVERRYINYPVRLFPYANRASFTFEYFVYPCLCILFNLYYPYNKGIIAATLHYIFFSGSITVLEYILEKKTQLIKYKNWSWYWTFSTLALTYYMSHKYYTWFFKIKKKNMQLEKALSKIE